MSVVYLIGSLRGKLVEQAAKALRAAGYEVFDDWFAAGPEADDHWQRYSNERGHTYKEALAGHAAQNVFAFDKKHLDRADIVVLVLPAGKSAHLELGYAIGQGKPGFVLFDEVPERYDVMYNFANAVCFSVDELLGEIKRRV